MFEVGHVHDANDDGEDAEGKLCKMPMPRGVAVALGRFARRMIARMTPCLATVGWEPLHSLAHVPFDLPEIARACFSLCGHS